MTIWQVAAGDGNHDYANVFLRFGVILVGPGSEGDYFLNRDAYEFRESWPRSLAENQAIGDLVVLKRAYGRDAEVIVNTIWRLRRVAKWYNSHSSDVGEHEIRTFLIVPLLISMGWAEQKIKIEWNNIDVTLFDAPYSKQSNPLLIIESKRLWAGLQYAPEQAISYAQSYPTCKQLIVSDGIRYKLFHRTGDEWSYAAYMNLLAPKRSHPYEPDVDGAVSFFLALIPNGNPGSSGDANE